MNPAPQGTEDLSVTILKAAGALPHRFVQPCSAKTQLSALAPLVLVLPIPRKSNSIDGGRETLGGPDGIQRSVACWYASHFPAHFTRRGFAWPGLPRQNPGRCQRHQQCCCRGRA